MASTRRLMRHPISWITLAWTGMLLAFMLVVPIYQAPDEPAHVDRVLDTARAGFGEWNENYIDPGVMAGFPTMRLSADPAPFSVDDAPKRPLPHFGDPSSDETSAINQLAGHPPAYYALVGGISSSFSQLLPQSFWQFDTEILLLRLINLVILMPLPFLIWRSARNLGMSRGGAVAGATFPLCVPQLAHIGSAVNNDNLLTLTSALTVTGATAILAFGLNPRVALAVGLSAAVAVQTKLLGLFVLPFLLVVCLVAVRREPRQWKSAAVLLGVMTLSTWWYVRNILLYGQLYPTRHPAGVPDPVVGFERNIEALIDNLLHKTMQSFWGSFGWLHLNLPYWWVQLLSALLLIALIAALVRPATVNLRLVLLPIGFVVPAYALGAWIGNTGPGYYPAQQGRYLFPLIVPLALAVASAATRVAPLAAALAASATAMFGFYLSLEVLFSGFWAGDIHAKIQAVAAWSPIGWISPAVICLGCLSFGLGLITACWLISREPSAKALSSDRVSISDDSYESDDKGLFTMQRVVGVGASRAG